MKKIFLEKHILVKLILVSVLLFMFTPLLLFFLWISFSILILFLFRTTHTNYKNSLSNSVDIILSPSSGKVSEIFYDDKNDQYIRIKMPFLGPYGVYLPYSSEIEEVEQFSGKKRWREANIDLKAKIARSSVFFKNKLGHVTGIHLVQCILGGRAKIWIKTGDRGRSTACYGYFPFGGGVVIKLPKNSEIMINKGETVKAGFTILAGLKAKDKL